FVLHGREPVWPEKPASVLSGTICPTGFPPQPGEECQTSGPELYWRDGQPSLAGIETRETWIKPDTGLPPAFGEVVDGLVLESHTFYRDPVTENYCLDCRRAVNEQGEVVYEEYEVSVN